MRRHAEFEANGVVGATLGESAIPIVRNQVEGKRCQTVTAQCADETLYVMALELDRRSLLGGDDFFHIALERVLDRHPLSFRARVVIAPDRLIFRAARLVVLLNSKSLGDRRPSAFANDGAQELAGVLTKIAMVALVYLNYTQRIPFRPKKAAS
jgi:hypothetical protein